MLKDDCLTHEIILPPTFMLGRHFPRFSTCIFVLRALTRPLARSLRTFVPKVKILNYVYFKQKLISYKLFEKEVK